MENSIVITGYSRSRYPDSDLLLKANQIIDGLKNNPAFPEPHPTLEVLINATENFRIAFVNAASGNKEATVIKNDMRKELEGVLKSLAVYVQITSKGSEALILGAGFDVRKKPASIGALEKPKNLTVKPGKNTGSVELVSAIVLNARFYIFEYTECPLSDGSKWSQVVNTRHNFLLEGLESRKEYVFRVAGGASSPVRVWSDLVYSSVL